MIISLVNHEMNCFHLIFIKILTFILFSDIYKKMNKFAPSKIENLINVLLLFLHNNYDAINFPILNFWFS